MRTGVLGLVIVLLVPGCSHSGSPVDGAPPSSAVPSAVTGGRYVASGDLCQVADLSPMTSLLPVVSNPRSTSDDLSVSRSLSCTVGLDNDRGDSGTFDFELTLYHEDGLAIGQYESIRAATQAFATVTDVPGLGQGAYRYADPMLGGADLNAYDGTLYLSIGWHSLGRSAPMPRLDQALADTALAAMRKFRVGDA
jgi:hypothetical protein